MRGAALRRAIRAGGAVLLAAAALASCTDTSRREQPPSSTDRVGVAPSASPSGPSPQIPTPGLSSEPSPAPEEVYAPLSGPIRMDDGRLLTVTPQGWIVDLASGEIRATYPSGEDTFVTGPAFLRAGPIEATVGFDAPAGTMALTRDGVTVEGERVSLERREVTVRSAGARLVGTFTIPPGPGPHPAVVVVHGAGPEVRSQDQLWADVFAARGVAALTYDKRGAGDSGGTYPGGVATESALLSLAGDAATWVRFLAKQPEIDRDAIGLEGASQAGWIIPVVALRATVAWTVILMGPTVSVEESDRYGDFSGDGEFLPSEPMRDILREVRGLAPFGFDPAPFLRRMGVPGLWIYGRVDRVVPTPLCAPGLFSSIDRWVAEHVPGATRI